MLGLSLGKGPFIITISFITFMVLMVMFREGRMASNLIAIATAGITIIGLSLYYQVIKKEFNSFFGIPTWVYGIVVLIFAIIKLGGY